MTACTVFETSSKERWQRVENSIEEKEQDQLICISSNKRKTASKFISKDEVLMQETARCLDVCLAELGLVSSLMWGSIIHVSAGSL
jgi:hypothetical protein